MKLKLNLYSPSLGNIYKIKEIESHDAPPVYYLPIIEPISAGPTFTTNLLKMATFKKVSQAGNEAMYVLINES